MLTAKPSHCAYHNPLQWNLWSRWCNISACNSPDFHMVFVISIFCKLLYFCHHFFVISIFCNLLFFRLQFSRFPYSATYQVIFVCSLPGFQNLQHIRFLPVFFRLPHTVSLKRFPPAVFENSFCNFLDFHNQWCKM